MNHQRIDSETAERMLRGQHTGPPALAELLAAASAKPLENDLTGEEAAVAAFRGAQSHPEPQRPRTRHLKSRLLTVKAALIALLLTLAGGVAMAATSQHLPGPLGNARSHPTRRPATSQTAGIPFTTPPPRHHTPNQHADNHKHHSQKKTRPKKKAHPKKNPKGNPQKATRTADAPST
jgi:hypothetical protein